MPRAHGKAGGVRFFLRGWCRWEEKRDSRSQSAAADATISSFEADGAEYFDHWRESGTHARPWGAVARRARRNFQVVQCREGEAGDREDVSAGRCGFGAQIYSRAEEHRQGDPDREVSCAGSFWRG